MLTEFRSEVAQLCESRQWVRFLVQKSVDDADAERDRAGVPGSERTVAQHQAIDQSILHIKLGAQQVGRLPVWRQRFITGAKYKTPDQGDVQQNSVFFVRFIFHPGVHRNPVYFPSLAPINRE